MDQLSVDNALRDINESGPPGEAVTLDTATKPKRLVCTFDDLTATQLRALTEIVRSHACQLHEYHLRFLETGADDTRIRELNAETDEILSVCEFQAYLKQKGEDEAKWANEMKAEPVTT